MAEFCTTCAEEHETEIDINIERIAFWMRKGRIKQTDICEGCGLYAIEKSKSKEIILYENKY